MKSALHLLNHVWTKNHATAWESLNHCMSDALNLAIGAKLEWEPADLRTIEQTMRPSYWMGEHGWERFYALAVWTDGASFIKAFEAFSGRKPFIANGVDGGDGGGYVHANSTHSKRGRIALRSDVWIDGERFECTSITSNRIVLTSRPRDGKKRTIKKLTHEDCAKLWPSPKKAKPTKETEDQEST